MNSHNYYTIKTSFLEVALSYAGQGLKVFPCYEMEGGKCSCGKTDCQSPGKHPRTQHGLNDATTDEVQIKAWWDEFPDANIGIRTGAESGLVVLDIDPRHGGNDTLEELIMQHGRPDTAECLTGGGGIHFYFRHPGGHVKSVSDNLPGVDVKADGGYVIAPPSNHYTGGSYEWEASSIFGEVELAPCPAWVLDIANGPKTRKAAGNKASAGDNDPIIAGGRNAHLTSLAGTLRRPGCSQEVLEAALMAENKTRCKPPLSDDEVRTIAKSVARYEPEINPSPKLYNWTDSGNAEMLADKYGDKLRYCFSYGCWLIWDGKRWQLDEVNGVYELAKNTMRDASIHFKEVAKAAELAAAKATEQDAVKAAKEKQKQAQDAEKFYKLCENKSKLAAMLFLAQSLLPVTVAELDADEWLMNCQNGIIDLKTGELLPHNPRLHMTKISTAAYRPEAACALWEETVAAIIPDEEVRAYIQRYAGYSLTGSVREEIFVMLYGLGGTGKGTLTETLAYALGDYADTLNPDILLQAKHSDSGNAPTPEIAKLPGVRMLLASETDKGRRLNEAKTKSLTGGDMITARKLRCDPFTFKPNFSLWLSTNALPIISAEDTGVWRRLRLAKFDQQFKDEEGRDCTLKDRLRKQDALDGVLTWAVRGCLDWQQNGMRTPAAIKAYTASFRADSDILAQFVADECEVGADMNVSSLALYQEYQKWCADNGHKHLNNRNFKEQMEKRGYRCERKKNGVMWFGIGLTYQ